MLYCIVANDKREMQNSIDNVHLQQIQKSRPSEKSCKIYYMNVSKLFSAGLVLLPKNEN
jgi:hypothetical protein